MSNAETRALLPEGLHDTLAPKAAFEWQMVTGLLGVFTAHGYEQVAPPIVEFEDSLLAGVGAAEERRMFRLMDPVSRRMMGVRTDMTTQVARIATTRLAAAPRPLRLCYAGQVLRVESSQLRDEREFGQAGIELIGTADPAAEAEVLLVAAEALTAAGLDGFTVDLTLPSFVPAVCAGLGLDAEETAAVRQALDDKDMAALAALDGKAAPVFEALLRAAGQADHALAILQGLDVPQDAARMIDGLSGLVTTLKAALPDLVLTIDPGEFRGFEYHSGICFSFFAPGANGELGRGGRYDVQGGDGPEPAVGFTVYVDSLLRALPRPESGALVYVPFGTGAAAAQVLREAGWRTVQGLDAVDDSAVEARRLGCTHQFLNGKPEEV